MLAAFDKPISPTFLITGALTFLVLVCGVMYAVIVTMRRRYHPESGKSEAEESSTPRADNPTAFMTASMQAVIQKLKEQEKELEQLHQRDRERAQETERLSEAVTSNMPSGLLLVNSTGLISSANPAAEAALEIRSLPFRRYTEVFGPGSRVARMIESCLSEGITFRRDEIEYTTPSRELRQLGVTISPITNKPGEVSGALCLLSDLTELAGLQKQIQMKESVPALG
jgi:PAS domain-containing protein